MQTHVLPSTLCATFTDIFPQPICSNVQKVFLACDRCNVMLSICCIENTVISYHLFIVHKCIKSFLFSISSWIAGSPSLRSCPGKCVLHLSTLWFPYCSLANPLITNNYILLISKWVKYMKRVSCACCQLCYYM